MRIEALPNKGPASLGPEIENCLEWANQVCVGTAFLGQGALERIEDALNQAERNGRRLEIRLLTGLYQHFTSAATIDRARRLQKAYPGKFTIRIARNNRFHWKLYLFARGNARRLYIGSANFTEDGLTASGECSIKIAATKRDHIAQSLRAEFDALWRNNDYSFSPGPTFIARYRKAKRPPRIVFKATDPGTEKLLKNAERLPRKKKVSVETRILYADTFLTSDAMKIVRSKTNWEERNWDYTRVDGRIFGSTRHADLVLYFTCVGDYRVTSRADYYLELDRVQESAVIKTPDGKYFIAHSKIPGTCRIKFGKARSALRQVGLNWEKLLSNRALAKRQMEVICNLTGATSKLINRVVG